MDELTSVNTAQKMKFSIKDFFSKCDQIHRKLRICSHLLKKSLMENFIFCAVKAIKCRWRSRRSKRNGIILDRKTTIIDARLLIIEHMYMDVLGCRLKSFLRQSYFRRGNKQREVRYQSRYQNSMNIAFFISSAGEKPDKPILIW